MIRRLKQLFCRHKWIIPKLAAEECCNNRAEDEIKKLRKEVEQLQEQIDFIKTYLVI